MKKNKGVIIIASAIMLLVLLAGLVVVFLDFKKDENLFIEVNLFDANSVKFNVEPVKYYQVTVKTGKLKDYAAFRKIHVFGEIGTTGQYVYAGLHLVYVDGTKIYIKYNVAKNYIVGDKPNKDNTIKTDFTTPLLTEHQFSKRFQLV